ncbi:MAG: hypothetical protein DLM68_12885 [Hyphomicrobiales bacterium]|nr:MAG: hypothetical protein DLM68_12885 [Hyphomicrobiales bacterium]
MMAGMFFQIHFLSLFLQLVKAMIEGPTKKTLVESDKGFRPKDKPPARNVCFSRLSIAPKCFT